MNLHLKYRPANIDEFKGNRGTVESIRSLFEKKNIPHSFMFVGKSGVGKTTLARIIAKGVGCDEIREINASDTRGIDYMRNLISSIRYKPLTGKPKAFILDEFHQATTDAQNALLKPLEDTPEYVYFMICTTNPEKILPTIQNRCYKYTLNPLTNKDILDLLTTVIKAEELKVTPEITELIIELSEGIPRTALVLLGMLHDVKDLDTAVEMAYSEVYSTEGIIDLCKLLMKGAGWDAIIKLLNELKETDFERNRIAMLGYFGGCLKNSKDLSNIVYYSQCMDILATPLNYVTGKNDFLLRMAKLWILKV